MVSVECSDQLSAPRSVLMRAPLVVSHSTARVTDPDLAMGVARAIWAVRDHTAMLVHNCTARMVQSSCFLVVAYTVAVMQWMVVWMVVGKNLVG